MCWYEDSDSEDKPGEEHAAGEGLLPTQPVQHQQVEAVGGDLHGRRDQVVVVGVPPQV